jgi:hypothetical protein
MCNALTFLSHMNNISFFFLLVSLGKFQHENYVSMWGHYGLRIVQVFLGPPSKVLGLTINILWWYGPSRYEGLCPIFFLKSWVLMVPYLYFRLRIFNRPVLEEYASQVERGLTYFNHAYV